jgi:hypothetical protein
MDTGALIGDMIRAGVDPALIARTVDALIQTARESALARHPDEKRSERNRRYYESKRLNPSETVLKASETSYLTIPSPPLPPSLPLPSQTLPSPHPPTLTPTPVHAREVPELPPEPPKPPKPKTPPASHPDVAEIEAYCAEIGLPKSDGQAIFDKWTGSGWKNGGQAIKDWKATIRAWKAQGYMPSQKRGSSAYGRPQGTNGRPPSCL